MDLNDDKTHISKRQAENDAMNLVEAMFDVEEMCRLRGIPRELTRQLLESIQGHGPTRQIAQDALDSHDGELGIQIAEIKRDLNTQFMFRQLLQEQRRANERIDKIETHCEDVMKGKETGCRPLGLLSLKVGIYAGIAVIIVSPIMTILTAIVLKKLEL